MIYIKKTPENLVDLIINLFSFRGLDSFTSTATFSDPECLVLQCRAGKYRSFQDVLECAQTYFPKTTAEELIKTLVCITIIEESKKYFIFCHNCRDINKPTFFFEQGYDLIDYDEKLEPDDEYKGMEWYEILDDAGFNNSDSLKKFVEKNKIIVTK